MYMKIEITTGIISEVEDEFCIYKISLYPLDFNISHDISIQNQIKILYTKFKLGLLDVRCNIKRIHFSKHHGKFCRSTVHLNYYNEFSGALEKTVECYIEKEHNFSNEKIVLCLDIAISCINSIISKMDGKENYASNYIRILYSLEYDYLQIKDNVKKGDI